MPANTDELERQIDDIVACAVCEGKHCANCYRERTAIKQLVNKAVAEAEKGLIFRLDQGMFFSSANPPGQHIKDCLNAERTRLAELEKGGER